jgi:SM-20-related protein
MDSISPTRIGRAVVMQEFLVRQELEALFHYALSLEHEFETAQVYDHSRAQADRRRARVSLRTGVFHMVVAERIAFYLRWITRALGQPYFDVSRVESQLTASNDGDYFQMHNDSTHANFPSRALSYVCFFHREPRPFEGGQLVIYDSIEHDGIEEPAAVRKRIVPEQGTMVMFPSACLHEVLPVRCHSCAFADSRFTLNGWVHG